MTGVIVATTAESAVAASVSERDSKAVVPYGTRDVGLNESHTRITGWMWLLVLYVIFSLTRDLWSVIRRCLRCRKTVKPGPMTRDDKVVIWTTKYGNKLHFARDCS